MDTGGKVFTEQELNKLLDRTDMMTATIKRNDDVKKDVNNNNNDDDDITSETGDVTTKNNDNDENAVKDNNNGGEGTHFKVVGVTNTEVITF